MYFSLVINKKDKGCCLHWLFVNNFAKSVFLPDH